MTPTYYHLIDNCTCMYMQLYVHVNHEPRVDFTMGYFTVELIQNNLYGNDV